MSHPPSMNWPHQPRPPYRIPAIKETTRLAGKWKALSGKVKIGVVAGGLLSLGAVGAMANPLTSTPSPQIPKFASASVSSPARPTSAAVTTKATTTKPATTEPAIPASVSVPVTTAVPATTATAAPTTEAATTAKTTTSAPKTTAATKATTTAAVKATVTPGAYCSVAGATGVTSTGKAMVCKTTATDTRLRWRAA
jgi:cytoskeletal protein RodZ